MRLEIEFSNGEVVKTHLIDLAEALRKMYFGNGATNTERSHIAQAVEFFIGCPNADAATFPGLTVKRVHRGVRKVYFANA